MLLPIILDPFVFDDKRYIWVYHKNLYHAFLNKMPIITHERYANDTTEFSEDFKLSHQFQELQEVEKDSVTQYFIPEGIFSRLISEKGSELSAKLFLLKNRYLPLEEILEKFLLEIIQKFKIEGIFNWAAHFESVKYLAKKYGIPIITSEFSLRFPNYRALGYFCYGDIYQEDEIKNRYTRFKEIKNSIDFNLFSREELLALFLDDSVVDYINLYRLKPKYEVGIAGVHPIVTTFFCDSLFTDFELAKNLRNEFDENEILFRMHPGEPYGANYGFVNQDTHSSPIPFILNCKRIAAQGSNIIFEAMLWNRGCYSRDVSPFAQFTERDFSNKNLDTVSEEFLNFVLFCYFVPMEKLWDIEYLKWRNSNPTELEIFDYHLKIYLNEKGIMDDILKLPKKKRLKMLLLARGL